MCQILLEFWSVGPKNKRIFYYKNTILLQKLKCTHYILHKLQFFKLLFKFLKGCKFTQPHMGVFHFTLLLSTMMSNLKASQWFAWCVVDMMHGHTTITYLCCIFYTDCVNPLNPCETPWLSFHFQDSWLTFQLLALFCKYRQSN